MVFSLLEEVGGLLAAVVGGHFVPSSGELRIFLGADSLQEQMAKGDLRPDIACIGQRANNFKPALGVLGRAVAVSIGYAQTKNGWLPVLLGSALIPWEGFLIPTMPSNSTPT